MRAENRSVGDPQFLVGADILAEIGKGHGIPPTSDHTNKTIDAENPQLSFKGHIESANRYYYLP
jgi:hypothetical protein